VVLTEERVVVSKEPVPVERVRLGTETVTEQQEVTEAVRKEHIELDDATVTDR
jgi:stress response protein YsnF